MEAQCRDSSPPSDLVCILTPWQNFMGEIKKRKKKTFYILTSFIRNDRSKRRKLLMLLDAEPASSWQNTSTLPSGQQCSYMLASELLKAIKPTLAWEERQQRPTGTTVWSAKCASLCIWVNSAFSFLCCTADMSDDGRPAMQALNKKE